MVLVIREGQHADLVEREHAIEEHRMEEQRRKHSLLDWEDLQPDLEKGCLAYEEKRYTAKLINLPPDVAEDTDRALEWCMGTPALIWEESYDRPRTCVRDREVSRPVNRAFSCLSIVAQGNIIAEWHTRGNEPTCRTYWVNHVKKVCICSCLVFNP